MKDYKLLIDPARVPDHIAIIMDGNRRWAEKRSLPGIEGHRKAMDIIDNIVEAGHEIGVKVLSLFAFSTENWSRSKEEIEGLWQLFGLYIELKRDILLKNGIRIRFCGFYNKLPKSLVESINGITELTKKNNKITLNMCLNYGGRQDILNAANKWIEDKNKRKRYTEKLTEAGLSKYLLTAGLPEIDLMIRTSGEYRISNFLIWQLAYSELVFLPVLWPDFRPAHLYKAICDYQKRDRRYGG